MSRAAGLPQGRALLLYPWFDSTITSSCYRACSNLRSDYAPTSADVAGICGGVARCGARRSRGGPCAIAHRRRHPRPGRDGPAHCAAPPRQPGNGTRAATAPSTRGRTDPSGPCVAPLVRVGPLPDALEDFAGLDVLLQRLERAATGLRHLGVDEEQRDPMAAKMKNTPLIWIASTSAGKNSARNPFVVHPKNTATPIPRPRMCSGRPLPATLTRRR